MFIPKALLLDAGNTVVFLDVQCLSAVLRKGGVVVEAAALREALPAANRAYMDRVTAGAAHEDGWTSFMSTLLGCAGVPESEVGTAVGLARAEHDRLNLWRDVPDGLMEALAAVRDAGIAIGIISNSEGKLDELFRHVGLQDAFSVVVDSHSEGLRKPDPAIFQRACSRIGIAPAHCLYAGDLPDIDVDGARGAGLEAVLIDSFGIYPDYDAAPRYASVGELCTALLVNSPAIP